MSVGGKRLIDGTAQVEALDNGAGAEINDLRQDLSDAFILYLARTEGIHHDGYGARHADGIGKLDLTLIGNACGYHVFGGVASGIASGTVYLCGVLARKGAAAVTGIPAVGIHDDLSSVRPVSP